MTKSIILVKICYIIQGVTNINFDKVANFLALADIKPFGHACLVAMLLLIGPALFYTPDFFV